MTKYMIDNVKAVNNGSLFWEVAWCTYCDRCDEVKMCSSHSCACDLVEALISTEDFEEYQQSLEDNTTAVLPFEVDWYCPLR